MSKADEPAFPVPETAVGGQRMRGGLSKREYFAAMAMQGMLANPEINKRARKNGVYSPREYARWAVDSADALLAELEKEPTR